MNRFVWTLAIFPFVNAALPPGSIAQERIAARPAVPPANETRYPSDITPYDVMTATDEFYYHHLSKLVQGGDIANWPLVRTIADLGADLLDANTLARAANRQFNISEQRRAQPIARMVNECADVLGVVPPPTYIEGNPFPNAYVAGLGHPHVLVMTSGLIRLYADSPDELRFVIGHELGHIKCQHLRTLMVGRSTVFPLMARMNDEGLDSVVGLLSSATLRATAFGWLMHWYREAEYSADRAGLLCVGGRVDVAQQALMRLLHQIRQSNPLMDDQTVEFDVRQLKQDQTDLRHRSLVQILSLLYKYSATHPFIPDRCVELQNWSESAEYEALMNRPEVADMTLQVTEVSIENIPATDVYVPGVDSGQTDPLVNITYAGTTRTPRRETDRSDVTWHQLNLRYNHVAGAGLILDLHDYNTLMPNRLVGSVRLNIGVNEPGNYETTGRLRLDIEEESTVVDLPFVKVKYSLELFDNTKNTVNLEQ